MSYEKLGFVKGQTLKAEHLNHMEEGISNASGADWNAKEGEVGYIENRTHYEEIGEIIILPETNYTLIEDGGIPTTELPNTFTLIAGNTYIVNWNGVKYTCECIEDRGILAIGDVKALESIIGAGEPFGILYNPSANLGALISNDGSTEVVLSVSEISTVVHKLNKKYLPDDIGGGTPIEFTVSEDGETVTCNLSCEELGKLSAVDLRNRSILYTNDSDGGLGIATYSVSGGMSSTLDIHYTISFQLRYSSSNPASGNKGVYVGDSYHVAFSPGYEGLILIKEPAQA